MEEKVCSAAGLEAVAEPDSGACMTSKAGLAALLLSCVFGVAARLLTKDTGFGLNIFLLTLMLSAAAWLLQALMKAGPSRRQQLWLLLCILASLLFCWRDAPALKQLDALLLFGAFAMMLASGREDFPRWHAAGARNLIDAAAGLVNALFSGFPKTVNNEIRWSDMGRGIMRKSFAPYLAGIAVTIPLVLLFGWLFMSADMVFSGMVRRLFAFKNPLSVKDAVLVFCFTWPACGFLRASLWGRVRTGLYVHNPSLDRIATPAAPVLIPLTALDLLFAAFILVQIQYLFGGDTTVTQTARLTYSEYARQGFFQLLAVVSLALPLLMLAEFLLRDASKAARRAFTLLAVVMAGLLLVVVASALMRMRLYTQAYGLTQLRFYSTALIFWLAVLVLWHGIVALPGKRHLFCPGVIFTGCCAAIFLHAVNPDAVIVRTNVTNASEKIREIDMKYLSELSLDAVPELHKLAQIPDFNVSKHLSRCANYIFAERHKRDLRAWTWSAYCATRANAENSSKKQ